MPWKETDSMKERLKFILEWERRWEANEGRVNVSELCRTFGVSRDTGHRLIRQYLASDRHPDAVREKSRKPHSAPMKVAEDIEAFVVAARAVSPCRANVNVAPSGNHSRSPRSTRATGRGASISKARPSSPLRLAAPVGRRRARRQARFHSLEWSAHLCKQRTLPRTLGDLSTGRPR